MTQTFIHRSQILGARMTVHFEKGKAPEDNGQVFIFWVDLSQKEAATKEFGAWIREVRATLKASGAKFDEH